MEKPKSINIVGCGIVGLITAITIKNLIPDASINMYDAGGHPQDSTDLVSTTFGKGRDARHFTGSESLSFQNPVHSRALRLAPGEHKDWAGWRIIPESKLTNNELRWRSDSVSRFVEVGHEKLNKYDDLHAQLNYAGMHMWDLLQKQIPYIQKYKLSSGPVSTLFLTKENFEDDLRSETNFLDRFGDSIQQSVVELTEQNPEFDQFHEKGLIYKKSLQLPGSSFRIRSLGLNIIEDLETRGVIFYWNEEIIDSNKLSGDTVIWTVGTTHSIPDIYKKYLLIQGIAGCWVSIPNPGFVNSLIGNAAWSLFQIASIMLLMTRTPKVFGWTREEILLLAAVYNVILSIFYIHFSRNFNELPDNIHYGRLDSFLVKPIDSQFLLSCWHMGFGNILRLIIGITFVGYLTTQMTIHITPITILGFLVLLILSITILYSVWFIIMTLTVWLSRLSNMVDVLYQVNWMMRYPQDMYRGASTFLFFIIFPLTFVVVSPTKVLLQKVLLGDIIWPIVLAIGLLFLSRKFWKFALRYYTSASG